MANFRGSDDSAGGDRGRVKDLTPFQIPVGATNHPIPLAVLLVGLDARLTMMWRAFFSAVGIVLVILGIECLLIDSAVLAAGVVDDPMALQQNTMFGGQLASTQNRIFRPAEWIPWSLLASGAVVLIYAISLRRANG